jgi:membrane associated rhomboid family serine protease
MSNQRSRNLIAIPTLVLLNVVAFFLQVSAGVGFSKYWALIPVRFTDGLFNFSHLAHELITLFTYQFLHGGLDHLFMNMLLLVLLGRVVEREFGNLRFFAYYLASGVVGALGFYAFNATEMAVLVGASGAISGIMGAFFVLLIRRRVPIAFWLWDQVISSVISVVGTTNDPVAYLAHLFGFICGAILTWRYCRRANVNFSTPFTLTPSDPPSPWDATDKDNPRSPWDGPSDNPRSPWDRDDNDSNSKPRG